MSKTNRPLKPRQQRFAIEYGVDHNGRQAAIRAGYKSDRAADIAWLLLKDDRVISVIETAYRCRLRGLEVELNRVGAKARARTFGSIGDLLTVDANGTIRFKRFTELASKNLAGVDEFIVSEDGQITGVKVSNPTESVLELMKIAEILTTGDCVSH